MENLINSKIDKQTIYDIYRACRLCGAGAGYKMPIIQTVVDLDANGVELKQKIRDCVQIEVNSDDKMPPLICELCVDKVNDFYEFMDMCQQTNKRTRLRLGLPPQSTGKVRNANYDSGDCILGVTEQVFGNDDSDEPLSASSSQRPKAEHKVKIKVEKLENTRDNRSRPESGKETKSRHENSRETRSRPDNSRNFRHRLESKESRSECSRESRSRPRNRECSGSRSPSLSPRQTRRKRPPTPPRRTRHGGSTNADIEEYTTLNNLKHQVKNLSSKSLPQPPKSILKMDIKSEDASKSKRCREPSKPDVPQKKVKLSVPPPRARPSRKPSPPPPHACMVCRKGHATSQALSSHVRVHTVTYTPVKLSCNACEEWFPTVDEAVTHHRVHKLKNRPYRCRRCRTKFKLQQGYDDHITNSECVPWTEAPLVKCPSCWRLFPTRTLLEQHKCGGADCRPGGKCMKCKRTYALLKNLKKHEETCSAKRKSEPIIDPAVRARLLPAAVRLWRCDPLLRGGRCHASRATQEYGFDPLCVYPYRRRRELAANLMVNIKAELDEFYDEEDYVHWDSECSEDEESAKSVCSLTTLALKTIFSRRCLGRVPRKRRKVKTESNAFDSVLNASGFDDIRSDIDNIIDNLGKDDDDYTDINKSISERKDNDSINSESLLCDAAGDKSEDFTAINDTDSQSLFSDGRNDEKHERTGVRELSVDESKVYNDSTDGDKTKVSRLSGECNDVNDKTDLISNNDKELSNHYFDNASTNSDLDNDDEARQTNDDCSGHHTRTDGQTNGDVDGKDNVTIGDDLVNHENTQSQLDTTNSNENHNETTVSENNEIMNEQVNAKTVNSTTHNTSTDSVSEVDQIERNHRDENAAICNDIENKINDLVSFNNSGENDYNGEIVNNDRFSVNETGASDELTPHCNVNTDEEKEELSLNTNIIDKDKITLDDLIPANDRETKSMDLDSISDGEFDFDA